VRPVVVFDTNILFSAIGWKGKPYQCLELARDGKIDAIVCRELLDELQLKLQSKLHFTFEQSFDAEVDLLSVVKLVPITGQLKFIQADPDDDKTVECALVAGASHIVTGDRRHLLPLGSIQGISIVTASQLLASAESFE
jgi:putative PIN family toxin of toxin-antitoxin system